MGEEVANLLSRVLSIGALFCAANALGLSVREDSVTQLRNIVVVPQGQSAIKRINSNTMRLSSTQLSKMTRTFGEADMINAIKGLAGVNTNGDYGSGLYVEGAEPSQTRYYIDGTPVIFPYRFGGLFSTFNSCHFSSAFFNRRATVQDPLHLGASIDFMPRGGSENGIGGIANVGLTASSASVIVANDNGGYIRASGRVSYIDQLYGWLLNSNSCAISYDFHDLNLNVGIPLSYDSQLRFTLFYNSDRLSYNDTDYANATGLHWKNSAVGMQYFMRRKNTVSVNAYYSSYSNILSAISQQYSLFAPSAMHTAGVKFDISSPDTLKHYAWKAATMLSYYKTVPQHASMTIATNTTEDFSSTSLPRPQKLFSGTIGLEITYKGIARYLDLGATLVLGGAITTSADGRYPRPCICPGVKAMVYIPKGTVTAEADIKTQYIHQAGFSELGLASDFWFAACHRAPLEKSSTASLSWQSTLLPFDILSEARLYASDMKNQVEYDGLVMEIVQPDYAPLDHIIVCNGYNLGASVALSREIGAINGSIVYSYDAGRRHKPGEKSSWRALNSTGHSLQISTVWTHGNWIFSSAFRMAQGRVYTPVESLYGIAGNIVMEYGRRNSARLPDYIRLDLGATYRFSTTRWQPLNHMINFSFINATGHRNVETQYYILSSDTGKYRMKRQTSLYRFLPSISYTIEF